MNNNEKYGLFEYSNNDWQIICEFTNKREAIAFLTGYLCCLMENGEKINMVDGGVYTAEKESKIRKFKVY